MKRPLRRVVRGLKRIVVGPDAPLDRNHRPHLETIDDWILFGPRLR